MHDRRWVLHVVCLLAVLLAMGCGEGTSEETPDPADGEEIGEIQNDADVDTEPARVVLGLKRRGGVSAVYTRPG